MRVENTAVTRANCTCGLENNDDSDVRSDGSDGSDYILYGNKTLVRKLLILRKTNDKLRILFIQKIQYPWMVRIVANSTAGPFVCGATLVSSKVRLHLFREEIFSSEFSITSMF